MSATPSLYPDDPEPHRTAPAQGSAAPPADGRGLVEWCRCRWPIEEREAWRRVECAGGHMLDPLTEDRLLHAPSASAGVTHWCIPCRLEHLERLVHPGSSVPLVRRSNPLRTRVIEGARKLLEIGVVVDTETTGVKKRDEVIQIAMIRAKDGEVLLYELVRPTVPCSEGAYEIHRIAPARYARAPQWPAIWPRVRDILAGHRPVAYNSRFDARLVAQTCRAFRLDQPLATWSDLMRGYLDFAGLVQAPKFEVVCESLGVTNTAAHDAIGDARATLDVLRKIAATEE